MKRILATLMFMILLAGCTPGAGTTSPDEGSSAPTETTTQPQPAEPSTTTKTESDEAQYAVESEIVINPGDWQLPGTLSMPRGDGPFPVVIFVHGSGPADRDETVGKQKLFKDLAEYLAKRGIACLRYDKRTYIYQTKAVSDVNLTVKEETIDDALYAAALVKTIEGIDSGKVFIAGHSMGGYLIPRICAADTEDDVAGYISLAGSARPMSELLLEQIDYALSLEASLTGDQKAAYRKQYSDAVDMVNALTEDDRGSAKAYMGAYATYWLDLAAYDPIVEAENVDKPVLFLQGGHDYQVTMTDFELWKTAFSGNSLAVFTDFPTLTHTFCETEGMGKPTDYNTYARVDERVADAIADFVKK